MGLSRREVHDSLAAFTVAAQRALSEPRAVQPPIELLERMQVRSDRLLAQLSAIRLWREQPAQAETEAGHAAPLLAHAQSAIAAVIVDPSAHPALHDAHKPSAPVLTETFPTLEAEAAGLPKRLQDAINEGRAVGREIALLLDGDLSRRGQRSAAALR